MRRASWPSCNNAVAAKPAGILISVADASVLQPGIDAAVSAGVPVITVDSDAAGSRRLYFIGTNNLEAGRLGGQRVVEKLGGKGNVVFFTLCGPAEYRRAAEGIQGRVLEPWPDIKIVDVVDIKGDPKSAFDKTQEYLALTGPKKIDAFVCLDSASGKPVADAVARGERRATAGGGVGCEPGNAGRGSRRARLTRPWLQKPFTMGYVGLKALDEVFHDPPEQLDKDLQRGLLLAVPGVCGYGHVAGGQEQRGYLHSGGGGGTEIGGWPAKRLVAAWRPVLRAR